jgi:hypothetical protein
MARRLYCTPEAVWIVRHKPILNRDSRGGPRVRLTTKLSVVPACVGHVRFEDVGRAGRDVDGKDLVVLLDEDQRPLREIASIATPIAAGAEVHVVAAASFRGSITTACTPAVSSVAASSLPVADQPTSDALEFSPKRSMGIGCRDGGVPRSAERAAGLHPRARAGHFRRHEQERRKRPRASARKPCRS